MSLSKDYTVEKFINQVFTDLNIDKNNQAFAMRYDIVNRAQVFIVSLFYDLLSRVYMTDAVLNVTDTGKYSVSDTGWWVASTATLVFPNVSAPFDTDDIGKIAIIRSGSSLYTAIVSGYVSGTGIILSGSNLPAADCTINDFMLSTTIPETTVSLSTLRIMRVGMNTKLELESTQSKYVEALTIADFSKWLEAAETSSGKIVWTLDGDLLKLKKADDLANIGTLILKYPRVAILVTGDDSMLDIPDGAPIELAMIRAKQIISRLLHIPQPDTTNEIMFIIKSMYHAYGAEISVEAIKEKIVAMQ